MPPTKTTNKPSAKKADEAKPSKAASAPKTSAKAEPPEKERKATESAPAEAKPRRETVSLIEPKKKVPRPRPAVELENKPFAHIPISRLLEPEPVKPAAVAAVPTPAAEPPAAAPAEASPAPAVESGVASEVDEKIIHLKPPFTIKDLATAIGKKPFLLMSDLMEMNIFASGINQTIEVDVAAKICTKHGLTFEREKRKEGGGVHKVEVPKALPKLPEKPKPDELTNRAPIVTFMGHVDHG